MADVVRVKVSELIAGQQLAQDIMEGDQVLLRKGSLLEDAHIRRLRDLKLAVVAIVIETTELETITPEVGTVPAKHEVKLPALEELGDEDTPSWLSAESFNLSVPRPRELPAAEHLFAERKEELRQAAGLSPMVDPQVDAEIRSGLHAAFMSSAVHHEINLDRIDELAVRLTDSLSGGDHAYIEYTDITRFGQLLAARSILSSKVFGYSQPGEANGLAQQVRTHLALANAFAFLPHSLDKPVTRMDEAEREALRDGMLSYYRWLRLQRFVDEKLLETVFLQHERFDGSGFPYGLSGEMIPLVGHSWAIANAYCNRLYSRHDTPRASPREAIDDVVRESGRAFSSSGVNRLLKAIGYYPNGSMVQLNNGQMALIVRQNQNALLKPAVMLVDDNGEPGAELDLQKTDSSFIARQVLEY